VRWSGGSTITPARFDRQSAPVEVGRRIIGDLRQYGPYMAAGTVTISKVLQLAAMLCRAYSSSAMQALVHAIASRWSPSAPPS